DKLVTGVQTCALPISIAERQMAVGALVAEPARRARLRALLRPVGDLERLTSRAALGQAHARDLVGLRACLEPLDDVRAVGGGLRSEERRVGKEGSAAA